MSDALVSVRNKIERAKKHIRDLDAALAAFRDSRPYEIAANQDPKTGRMLYVLGKADDIPVDIGLITGDAIHNLRSALDHLACAAVGSTKRVSYPICDTVKQYKDAIKDMKKKGIGSAAKKLIDATKPYKRGNRDLWVLHKLDIIDKHRLILATAVINQGVDLLGYMLRMLSEGKATIMPNFAPKVFYKPVGKLRRLKAGDQLLSAPHKEPDQNLKAAVQVAIWEPEVVTGKGPLEITQKLLQLVDGIANSFAPLF